MIKIHKFIDTDKYIWCRDAALIQVTEGKSALKKSSSDCDYNTYDVKSVLTLNGKQLVQQESPICPTCSGLLARGYGIENINSKELQEIRDRINSEYHGLNKAIENISSVLELLEDGYYVIADSLLYPTDGQNHFFANVSDSMTYLAAAADSYYVSEFLTAIGGFPAYLYPTQSNSSFNSERISDYLDVIDTENAPRAVAYYDYGFVCDLIDGHHKAYAAAVKGCVLPALVIIPLSYEYTNYITNTEYAGFAEIEIPVNEIPGYQRKKPIQNSEVSFESVSNHNQPVPEDKFDFSSYPTIDELAGFMAADIVDEKITVELMEKWIHDKETDKLRYALIYYSKSDLECAEKIARFIITMEDVLYANYQLIILAYKVMSSFRNDETEKIMLDYLINHKNTDIAWDICSSYFE